MHHTLVNIPKSLRPQPKAPTVTQRRDIKKYGSLEAAKEFKAAEQIGEDDSAQVTELIEKINSGKITNVNQIPQEYRDKINVDQTKLNEISNYYQAELEAQAYNAALNHFKKGNAGLYLAYVDPKTQRQKLITKYLKEFRKQEKAGNIVTDKQAEKAYKERVEALKEPKMKVTVETIQPQILGEKEIKNLGWGDYASKPKTLSAKDTMVKPNLVAFTGKATKENELKMTVKQEIIPAQYVTVEQLREETRKENIKKEEYRRYVPIPKKGTGKKTAAYYIGGGKIQDFVITYKDGKVIGKEAIGRPVPISNAFKELARKEQIEKDGETISQRDLVGVTGASIFSIGRKDSVKEQISSSVFQPYPSGSANLQQTYPSGQGTMSYKNEPITLSYFDKDKFTPGSFYLGDTEYRTQIQKNYGTQMTQEFSNIKPDEQVSLIVGKIKPDYSTSISNRVTEVVPGLLGMGQGATVLTQQDESLYLPDEKSTQKFQALLEKKGPTAAKNVRVFVREQQAQFKKDIGEYNKLKFKLDIGETLTQAEYEKSAQLVARINRGQRGTLRDVIYESTEEAQKTNQKTISPRVLRRGLIAGEAAYNVEKNVLIAQAGVSAVSLALGVTATGTAILGGITKISKPLSYANIPFGLGYGGFSGLKEYGRRGDTGDAIAAGLGASAGFFGSIYSKQIVEGTGRLSGRFAESQKKLLKDTRATASSKSKYDQQPVYEEAKARAARKGTSINKELREINLEKELRLENIRQNLKYASKKKVLAFVKKALADIKASNMSETQKIQAATRLNNYIRDVRPDLYTTNVRPLQDASPRIFNSLETNIPSFKIKGVSQDVSSASAYAGLGQYERTQDQQVGQLQFLLSGQATQTLTKQDVVQESGVTTESAQSPESISRTIQDSITTPEQDTISIIGPGIPYQRPRTPTKEYSPGIIYPGVIDIDFGGRRRREQEMAQTYYGEVKVGKKYKRVTEKPYTKKGAFDVVARIVDNTISAQGRVVPGKKKAPANKINKGDGYYNQNRNKFRNFSIFAGQKKPLKDTIIEKKNRRLDTPGEVRGLSVSQFLSQGKLGRPKKKMPFIL